MPNERSSTYKAHAITTRWSELATTSGHPGRRFEASFTVAAPKGDGLTSWQRFSEHVFDTAKNATDHALVQAKRLIDRSSGEI
jgi:hypothetical protein